MINYPNGKKQKLNESKISSANRGMNLENDLNKTNQYYLDFNIANIHKKPTPIQIVHVDYPKRSAAKITEAYFKLQSTTDYNGVYKSCAIDFEAKECRGKSFPLNSIHKHQIEHLKNVLQHGAITFVIIRFINYDKTFFVLAKDIIKFYENKENTRKSIPFSWFDEKCRVIPYNLINPVNYLKIVDELYF
ncbi:MAG: Holliday junction resolvase RecU [Erysipelotrichaceae bacterium]|nr:Holliday junction resolvase RecU [Erysipelotrichaceae bacterium]